jgi:hypothetical protein
MELVDWHPDFSSKYFYRMTFSLMSKLGAVAGQLSILGYIDIVASEQIKAGS